VSDVALVNSFDGRAMYAEYLRENGLTVCEARRPEDALQQLATCHPTVIITDVVFLNSSMNGLEFVRAIRQNPATQDATIIVISGYVRRQDQNDAHAAGADLFVAKPCLPEDLLAEVRYAVESVRRGERPTWHWTDAAPDRRRGDRRVQNRRSRHGAA
jgi:CheY-like chemotaxis protein